MNVVFLSPNFPPQYRLFCEALRARGATVLAIGEAPAHDLEPSLRAALTEYLHVPHMERYDELLRAVAYLTWRHGRIDHIDSLNEHWLGVEAQLRDDFNIDGLRPREAARQRSKSGMDELLRGAGLRPPAGVRVTSPADVRAFVERVGYPVLFKPDLGVGADATFRVDDAAGLEAALREPREGYVLQEFVTGRVTTYDGLTDRDGNVLFAHSFVYCAGVMEILRDKLDVYYYTRRELPPELVAQGDAAVRAFDLRGRFFHAEFFELPDGTFRPLEVNLRPAGGFSTDLLNYASDMDLYDLWAAVVTGDDTSWFSYERRYHAAHLSRRWGRSYALPSAEVARALGEQLVLHRVMPAPLREVMGDELFLVRTRDEASMRAAIDLAHRRA